MGGKKIKVDKKRVDRAEEIVSAFDQVKAWTDEHQVLVSAVVVVLLLVPLIFWGFSAYEQNRERKASVAYTQAVEAWPDKNDGVDVKVWEDIISKLKKCAEEYAGTKAGLDAQLDMARAFFHVGRYEEAAMWSGKVLEQAQPGESWKQLAQYQLAQTYEMLGRPDEALVHWEALKQHEQLSGLKREVDWHLAALYFKKEQYGKAVDHYGEALNAPGGYPSTQQLQVELASARMKAGPTEGSQKENP